MILNRKARELDEFQRDHLPFGTILLKLVATMPNAPKKPDLNVVIKPK